MKDEDVLNYPRSPEARYTAALDHVVALTEWLAMHGPKLGLDPARLVIGGDSAGANLALATCLRVRDAHGAVPLLGLLSNYGAFSGKVSDAAEALHGGPDAILSQAEMTGFFAHYCASPADAASPYAVPLDAPDLSRLPPVRLTVPDCDVLAEQSFAMADRLTEAGVAVTTNVYASATHSFLEAMSVSTLARTAIADGARWTRQRLEIA